MATQVSSLLRFITPDVPACPDITVQQALMRTAADFCRRTHLWSELQDDTALTDGEANYAIDPPAGALTVTVLQAWVGARALVPKSMEELALVLPDWQTATGSEPTFFNSRDSFGSIVVYPTPAAPSQSLRVLAAYEPKLDAATVPDFLVQRYLDALEHGTKSRLMLMRGQQWSDIQLGDHHQRRYEALLGSARSDQLHSLVPGSLRVQPRRFGG